MTLITGIAGLVAAIVMGGCVAVSHQETPEQFMNSSIITTSVKTRLANEAGLETLSLTVQTLNGATLLGGFAQNEEQKKIAGKIAENTQGVHRVINNIVVQ